MPFGIRLCGAGGASFGKDITRRAVHILPLGGCYADSERDVSRLGDAGGVARMGRLLAFYGAAMELYGRSFGIFDGAALFFLKKDGKTCKIVLYFYKKCKWNDLLD